LRVLDAKATDLDLVVAGRRDAITMAEAGAREVSEERILEALDLAHAEIKRIIGAIDDLVRQVGRPKITVVAPASPEVAAAVRELAAAQIAAALRRGDKQSRETALAEVAADAQLALVARFPGQAKAVADAVDALIKT